VICIAIFIVYHRSGDSETEEEKRRKRSEAAKSRIGFAGYSELMFASSDGDVARVRELLAYGADVNQQDDEGGSALMYAALSGHKEIVDVLLSSGADVHLTSRNGMRAAAYAERAGFSEIAERMSTVETASRSLSRGDP
jgi:ankyrin repeat protein